MSLSSAWAPLLTLGCTCLAEDFEDVLELVADVVRHPAFPDDEVETRRAEIVTAIRQDEDNPAVLAVEALMALLYADGHPYGRRTKGTVASVEAITRADLVGYPRARFRPAGLMVVIVGDVGAPRAVATRRTRAFGDWRVPPAPLLAPPPAPAPRVAATARHRRCRTRRRPTSPTGSPPSRRLDPDYYAARLMNNVLGQYGLGGRLGDSIRERQGMAYYAFSSFDGTCRRAARHPGRRRAGERGAHDRVHRRGGPAHRRGRASRRSRAGRRKRYSIGSMPRKLETNAGIASFLHTAEFFGLGLDYDRRVPALLDAVTLDEVHAATAGYSTPIARHRDRRPTIVARGGSARA